MNLNWLQKLSFKKYSSITFSLEGGNKISQPKTTSDLSSELAQFAFPKMNNVKLYGPDSLVEPDGYDWDRIEGGTINWYVVDNMPLEDQKNIIYAWFQEMELFGYQFNISGIDTSRMRGTPVIRIDVIENGSKNYMNIPSINLSNDNAREFMTALDINYTDSEYYDVTGSVSVAELKHKLDNFNEWVHQQLVRDRYEEEGLIDFGRSYEQISGYVSRFRDMINFAEKNNFNTIIWY